VIRNEALFRARVSPWRKVSDLTDDELLGVVAENKNVMDISMAKGRRPKAIYKAHRERCPNCGGEVLSRGQGDDNRTAFWCPRCQP
jgi:endonuclease-8